MPAGYSVKLTEITKSFGDTASSVPVLANVSADVAPGEFLAVCGRSGVGKSTLLRLIAGLEPPTSGAIAIDEQAVAGPPRGLGYVVQDYSNSLFPWLKVKNNLKLALSATSLNKRQKEEAIASKLEAVGLADYANHYPWQLSGGMQQRVALARALVTTPQLLLMDEPFASVDAHIRLELEDLTSALVREAGITTIFVTHDIDEAVYMADRIWVLSGKPAHISQELTVPLGMKRDQRTTRSLPEFLSVRDALMDALSPENQGNN